MKNLYIRTIAGIIFSVAVVGSALLGSYALGFLFLFFAIVGLYEIYTLLQQQQVCKPRWVAGIVIGILIYILVFLVAIEKVDVMWVWLLALLMPIIFCFELLRLSKTSFFDLSGTIFGWIYIVIPFSLINFLAIYNGNFEFEIPLGFFLILWANDTGAYFIGKFFGKRKLYAKVSPNKTWEGLFGGVVASFIVSYFLSQYFIVLACNAWMVMTCIIVIFGNLGDLFESHLKRNFGVKDSGQMIPGHGGILDRFDGMLLTLPVLIFYFKVILAL